MVDLIQFIGAICPQQKIDRATAIAWYEVIGTLPFTEARTAVIAVKHSQAFVDVSDIEREARRARDCAAHPSSRTVASALEHANRRELDPAGGTPATEEFLTAKAEMLTRMGDRDRAAFTAGPEAQRKAQAWIDGAIRGRQPVEEPLGVQPGDAPMSRWAILPDDPPELKRWLRGKQLAETQGHD